MAFCSGCGTEVGADVAFCPKCGKSLSAAPPAPIGAAAAPTTGLQENVAGFLCYILGWVTGLIFFLIDKRPFVRFHAMQSMITFGALFVIQWVFVWGGWFGGILGYALMGMIGSLIGLLALVAWILCMVKAYQGQRFKLPVIGDLAENYSK
jgi:uncharacterized membrane protein